MRKKETFFARIEPVTYRWYRPERMVLGKRMVITPPPARP